jgi:xylan 1,4-beta-xylosidase
VSTKIPNTANLRLRITGEEKIFSFAYAIAPGQWQTLVSDVDATPITVQAAGGGLHFTGAVIGLHARTGP